MAPVPESPGFTTNSRHPSCGSYARQPWGQTLLLGKSQEVGRGENRPGTPAWGGTGGYREGLKGTAVVGNIPGEEKEIWASRGGGSEFSYLLSV